MYSEPYTGSVFTSKDTSVWYLRVWPWGFCNRVASVTHTAWEATTTLQL